MDAPDIALSSSQMQPAPNQHQLPKRSEAASGAGQSDSHPVPVQVSADPEGVVKMINEFIHAISRELLFVVDASQGTKVIEVRDADGNTIRRIPLERSMALVEKLRDLTSVLGLVVDEIA